MTPEARRSFQELVATFTNSLFLVHFDAKRPIRLETDASGYAISGILLQKQETEWKVVAYFSRKMINAKRNYEIHDAELLAIVESFCHWRHYLEQPYHTVEVFTDHSNLRAFMSTHKLTRRQVRWALDLSAFDFRLVYRKGTLNPADGPSRRPDYQRDAELEDSMTDNTSALQRMLFPTVATVTSQPMSPTEERARQILVVGTSDSQSSNQRRQARGAVSKESLYEDVSKSLIDALPEFLRADPLAKKVTQRMATRESNSDLNIDLRDWTQRGELLYKGSVLYIPEVEALRMEILKKHHDDPLAGHLATKKTYNTLRHKFFWLQMYKQVDEYCTSCFICQGARVICGKQQWKLQPLPIPMKAWDVFSIDFITGLPESVAYRGTYEAILVVVDKLSKMCH